MIVRCVNVSVEYHVPSYARRMRSRMSVRGLAVVCARSDGAHGTISAIDSRPSNRVVRWRMLGPQA